MVLRGAKVLSPVLTISLAIGAMACDKAKEALENELGIAKLEDDEIQTMKDDAGWTAENDELMEVVLGLRITDKFDGDFGTTKAYDLPFLPDNLKEGSDASGKSQEMLLLRKLEFNTGIKDYTRFEIVNVAKVNDEKQLEISGETMAQYIDEKKRVNKANGQDGDYLLVRLKDSANAFSFLSGTVTLKKQSGDSVPVGETLVFTEAAPFVTRSGSEKGQYLLAMFKGQKGYVTGFNDKIETYLLEEGIPRTTSAEISYAGAIPQEEIDAASTKANNFNNGTGDKVDNWASKANDAITPFFGGWQIQPANLVFIEPKKDPPPPPTPAPAQAPEPPTEEKPADPAPPEDSPVMRRDPTEEANKETVNIDLGCTGLLDDGTTATLTTDGAEFATFKGWRGLGDVRITAQEHTKIFGDPTSGALDTEKRYLDRTQGYCVVSSGNGLHQLSKTTTEAPQLAPKDGKTSEMWQPLKIPTAESGIKSIQVRYAFFSQEYPDYVGTGFNDSFFIKFDESTEMIASGTLNDLAGEAVSGCAGNYGSADKCGDWESIKSAGGGLHGELWDIGSSTEATTSAGSRAACLQETNPGTKCFHGWVPPRVICKVLKEEEMGKELTLRISVSDAGDHIYDSALAVDSIVFSKEGCGDAEIFSGDERSPVSQP